MKRQGAFLSFFLGGFECSTHVRPDGVRLDLIASTGHDVFAESDYRRLQAEGIYSCRDGLRWHLIEQQPGIYDFASALGMIRAAEVTGMQVIWDIFHYGWPNYLDILSPDFVTSFARYAAEAAQVIARHSEHPPWFTLVNEPSFMAWAGGNAGFFPPFLKRRGDELKKQLVRCIIAGTDSIRAVVPEARFLQVDPVVHVVTVPGASSLILGKAERYRMAQYHALDMLIGTRAPELGGSPDYLDVIGCNYYTHNQWEHGGKFIERSDFRYRPLHELLSDVAHRYGRPILLAETGTENELRPDWLRFICDELAIAQERGVAIEGACLYPILNHPGWDDNRHCHNGMWDYCNIRGEREIYGPLASELRAQRARFEVVPLSPEPAREPVGMFA